MNKSGRFAPLYLTAYKTLKFSKWWGHQKRFECQFKAKVVTLYSPCHKSIVQTSLNSPFLASFPEIYVLRWMHPAWPNWEGWEGRMRLTRNLPFSYTINDNDCSFIVLYDAHVSINRDCDCSLMCSCQLQCTMLLFLARYKLTAGFWHYWQTSDHQSMFHFEHHPI